MKGLGKDRIAEISEDGLQTVADRVERYIEDVRSGATELTSPEAKREFTTMTRELVIMKRILSMQKREGERHDA